MAEEVDFSRERPGDAIVVGAGPAGTAAAITMARKGLQVMLIERGQKPGAKNVMGGILYNHYLEEVLGDDWKSAPLERPIIREDRWIMTADASINIGYNNLRNQQHPHSYSVLRARFDPWFSGQAEAAGAFVLPETVVTDLVLENGRVAGVSTGREGDVFAKVVIVCEGVGLGAGLLEKAGLKRKARANEMAMAVKEIIVMDPARIEERFNLAPTQKALIVRESEGEREAVMARWGLLPHWAKDERIAYKLINARAETLLEKPAFRSLVDRYRYLVVADGFYEWTISLTARSCRFTSGSSAKSAPGNPLPASLDATSRPS